MHAQLLTQPGRPLAAADLPEPRPGPGQLLIAVKACAICRTASESAGDAIGNPASMMSTPSVSSARAMVTLPGTSSEKPGACSPSRRVVSKTETRAGLLMHLL